MVCDLKGGEWLMDYECLCEFEAVSVCDDVSVWRLRNCCHLVCLSANVAASESVTVAVSACGTAVSG